jgi:hypothetical protein
MERECRVSKYDYVAELALLLSWPPRDSSKQFPSDSIFTLRPISAPNPHRPCGCSQSEPWGLPSGSEAKYFSRIFQPTKTCLRPRSLVLLQGNKCPLFNTFASTKTSICIYIQINSFFLFFSKPFYSSYYISKVSRTSFHAFS